MAGKLVTAAFLIAVGGFAFGAEIANSDTCGSCHRDIYRMWRDSAHAEATENPFFYEIYREIREGEYKSRARACLACHAPLAVENNDPELKLSSSREGVSCDFCHSLARVDLTERGPVYQLDVGSVKRGTIAEADSPAHGVAFSELHRESRICAPCHEYVTDEGTVLFTTYSEWKSSRSAARGETCQSCHMGLTEADVVDPKLERKSSARVNLHEMPGGHSIHQLLKALDVKVDSTRRENRIGIEVTVTNEGAGHAVPTGSPGRRIVLVVMLEGGDGSSFEERRAYSKTYLDAKGKRIERAVDYFGKGVRLEADTRIRADEVRKESFRFSVPDTVPAYVTVKLQYEHSPRGEAEERVWMTFYTFRRLLKRTAEG